MDNMEIYNAVRTVPANAKKEIGAGRLKGKTDINPMWRIKTLTETFGACGIGWKYDNVRYWLEHGANDEISAFCSLDLHIKNNGEWSEAIPGIGGSAFVAKEKNGLYTSDECYKMALTDALSVACKALGIGADVYWDKDATKYTKNINNIDNAKEDKQKGKLEQYDRLMQERGNEIRALIKGTNITADMAATLLKDTFGACIKVADMDEIRYKSFLKLLQNKIDEGDIEHE